MLYNQDSFLGNKYRAQNLHSESGGHTYERVRCPTCGKQHGGKCLAGTDGCFACGNKGHKMRYFPKFKSREKDGNQASYILIHPRRTLLGDGG